MYNPASNYEALQCVCMSIYKILTPKCSWIRDRNGCGKCTLGRLHSCLNTFSDHSQTFPLSWDMHRQFDLGNYGVDHVKSPNFSLSPQSLNITSSEALAWHAISPDKKGVDLIFRCSPRSVSYISFPPSIKRAYLPSLETGQFEQALKSCNPWLIKVLQPKKLSHPYP